MWTTLSDLSPKCFLFFMGIHRVTFGISGCPALCLRGVGGARDRWRHNGGNAQCVCGCPLVPLKSSRYKGLGCTKSLSTIHIYIYFLSSDNILLEIRLETMIIRWMAPEDQQVLYCWMIWMCCVRPNWFVFLLSVSLLSKAQGESVHVHRRGIARAFSLHQAVTSSTSSIQRSHPIPEDFRIQSWHHWLSLSIIPYHPLIITIISGHLRNLKWGYLPYNYKVYVCLCKSYVRGYAPRIGRLYNLIEFVLYMVQYLQFVYLAHEDPLQVPHPWAWTMRTSTATTSWGSLRCTKCFSAGYMSKILYSDVFFPPLFGNMHHLERASFVVPHRTCQVRVVN